MNYQVKMKLGSGSFSKVYMAVHNQTQEKVAIKMISKKANNDDGKQLIRIAREINILKKAKHPYIAELYETYETEDFTFLIMEYAPGGTILSHVREVGAFPENEAAIIFAQLIVAMKHLQKTCNVAHRDIKAENVLFDVHHNIRLIDFGLSNMPNSDNLMTTQCGSLEYASPEMVLGQSYSYSSDIWSAGVCLYAMITGELPFEDANMPKLAQKIIFKEVDYPDTISDNLLDLLKKMLAKDANERITLDQIIEHPWVHSSIQRVVEAIGKFEFDNTKIRETLSGMNVKFEDVVSDNSKQQVTQNVVSYLIVRKNYMSNNIPDLRFAPEDKHVKMVSSQEIVALPRLIINRSKIDRKSLPIQDSPVITTLRRKIRPSLIRNQ